MGTAVFEDSSQFTGSLSFLENWFLPNSAMNHVVSIALFENLSQIRAIYALDPGLQVFNLSIERGTKEWVRLYYDRERCNPDFASILASANVGYGVHVYERQNNYACVVRLHGTRVGYVKTKLKEKNVAKQ
eukprot:scaffold24810_cov20-Tisochrysis_lutea.AAC.2